MDNTTHTLKIFLCHTRSDKDAIKAQYERLVKDSVDTWLGIENLSLAGTVGISWKNKER